jgi:hypothetical protein
MKPESTPIKSKPPGPPHPLSIKKKKAPSPFSPIQPLVISSILKRGGTHSIYGVFLGEVLAEAGWDMPTASYRFLTQRRDEKSVTKVERGLTDAREKTTTLKFNGTLELDGTEGVKDSWTRINLYAPLSN